MSISITDRQQRILKAIVSEYMDGGDPVGSANLVKKYDIPACPATVRYEMSALSKEGLIEKPHRSAGRVPTITGLRYYLAELYEKKIIDYMLEVDVKQRLHKVRFDREMMLRECVAIMAEKTKTLGFCLMIDGARIGGITNLLILKKKTLQTVFALLEDEAELRKVLSVSEAQGTKVLLGEEIGLKNMEECSVVYHDTVVFGEKGSFGVLGPLWMDYREIIPLLELLVSLAQVEAQHWGKGS